MSRTTSTSIKHLCWVVLRAKPQTIRDVVEVTGLYYEPVSAAIRGMAKYGQALALNEGKRNVPVVYAATDREPQLAPRHAYPTGNKPKRERPLPVLKQGGNGYGKIELEKEWAWPQPNS